MLVSKLVQIEFASPKMKAIDAIQDLRKGVQAASLNLYARHDVQLQWPMPFGGDKVVLKVKIPEDKVESFSLGNHLRGISAYLLKYCDGKYDEYVVGKRLLNYVELSETEMVHDSPSLAVRMEMISDFSRLLKRSDLEAIERINQIRSILEDRNQ